MHAPTILLVDDHAPTREAYAAFLLDDGFDVLQAGHGGEVCDDVLLKPCDPQVLAARIRTLLA